MAWPKGKPRPQGAGRKKGTPNKFTRTIKEHIEVAFAEVGGSDYLVERAKDNAAAFLNFVGKAIPLQVDQKTDSVTVHEIRHFYEKEE